MGWGATCNGQAASGLWTGPRLLWHINCLELWAVHLALRQFRPLLLGKHVLVRTDNTAAVSYINRLRGIRSHRMSQLARHLLLWSHTQFKSLRAVHIPGQLNRVADALSRQLTFPGEWRLHPETIRLIWSRFGEAQVEPPPSPPTASCTSPWPRAPSAQTHWHTAGLGPYASMRFPQWAYSHRHCASSGRTRSRSCWLHPIGPPGPGFPNSFPSWQHLPGAFLWGRTSAPYGTRIQIYGTSMCGSWTGRGRLEWPAVVETIIQARAPSTRQTYALKWSLFVTWCSSRREDPQRCTIGVVLSFLQERLERRLSPSTLKVWNPSRPPLVPSWDLSIVLAGLQRGPFSRAEVPVS